jgi:putative membrane protein
MAEEHAVPEIREERESKVGHNRRVHMANERTFLAWVRTSIAIMAFGFVVEKFSLFVKQMAYYLGKEVSPPPPGYSSIIGIVLVGLGVVMGVIAFVRYKTVERQIDEDAYRSSAILSLLLTLAMIAIGVFLMLYLVHSMCCRILRSAIR